MDDVLISKFLQRLKNDEPHDLWFEAIQEKVFDVLKTDDHFFPAFKKSSSYVKMLLELEIIDEVVTCSISIRRGPSEFKFLH